MKSGIVVKRVVFFFFYAAKRVVLVISRVVKKTTRLSFIKSQKLSSIFYDTIKFAFFGMYIPKINLGHAGKKI
jgi:hypothetical protein